MYNKIQSGDPFRATATHATLAVASKAAVSGKTHLITSIAVSSDKAGAICLIKSGTTVIWQVQVGAVGGTASDTAYYSHDFPVPLIASNGELVSVEIDGTSACKSNIIGVTV